MSMLHVSEKHRYDSVKNVIILQDGTEKTYDNIGVKIEIYDERLKGWFFNVAQQLVKDGMSPGDYVATMVALSYFEGVEQFIQGKKLRLKRLEHDLKRASKKFFRIKNVLSSTACGQKRGAGYFTQDSQRGRFIYRTTIQKLLIQAKILYT